MITDLLENIAVICQLHHNAKHFAFVIDECLLVLNNVWMSYRRKYANLIDCILALFLTQVVKFDLLHCVLVFVFETPDLVYLRVSAIPDLLNYFEVVDRRVSLEFRFGRSTHALPLYAAILLCECRATLVICFAGLGSAKLHIALSSLLLLILSWLHCAYACAIFSVLASY